MPYRTPPNRQQVVANNERKVRLPSAPTTNPILAEQRFIEWAEREGWTTTKRGWPDFMCRRGDELMAVEVKAGKDGLRPEQIATIRDLHLAGLPTYLWTPETGLTRPIVAKTTDSIPTLRAERAALMRMVRDAYSASMEMRKARRRLAAGRHLSDETRALIEVGDMCHARHKGSHQSLVPDAPMNLCSWLVKMSAHISVERMAEIVGLDVEVVVRNLKVALDHRERFLRRIRPDAA